MSRTLVVFDLEVQSVSTVFIHSLIRALTLSSTHSRSFPLYCNFGQRELLVVARTLQLPLQPIDGEADHASKGPAQRPRWSVEG